MDPCTKIAHEQKEQTTSLNPLPLLADISPNEMQMTQVLINQFDSTLKSPVTYTYKEQPFTFLPCKKRVKTSTFRYITEAEPNKGSEYETDDIQSIQSDEFSSQDDDSFSDNDKFLNVFEDYTHPTFDFDEQDTSELPKEGQFTWILIWIMKFKSNYNIPNTATEVLIKFVKLLLKECGNPEHESFLNSLYMARKFLGIVDRFMSFAACRKCHKLYKKEVVIAQDKPSIMNCNHIEFSNSNTRRFRQCQTPLGKKITLNSGVSVRPELIYPVTSIQQQISSMFL